MKCVFDFCTNFPWPFWSYLWGIEIKKSASGSNNHDYVLILPMRDWNRFQRRCHRLKIQVLILPMRDWNFHLEWRKHPKIRVLILPMRDWNNRRLIRLWITHSQFWSYLWGIEIGKKICSFQHSVVVLILPMRDWNMKVANLLLQGEGVLILPMRDWNYKNTVKSRCIIVVLILPMRDWNVETLLKYMTAEEVLILPMRDWNKTTQTPNLRLLRFDLTYEGLKLLIFTVHNRNRIIVLILPMRDWNSSKITC